MRTKNFVITALIFAFIIFCIILYNYFDFRIDACLDKGGSWNSKKEYCELDTANGILDKVVFKTITLKRKTIVVVSFDSLQLEKIKQRVGEDNFYTAMDDAMTYNAQLIAISDSLKIPMITSSENRLKIKAERNELKILKDTLDKPFTYFYFDGLSIKEREIFDLLSNLR